eukprot:TRINITY_DN3879_c0_g1_i15.p1 TRINITY_DN3879_c0_g1~~TRINITY_DN3879_c0_g1_i15.p1  ORF type:complete len:145 (-),score=21.79 TRINITY_DN3879_c0_g1_i15:122-556(-)
MCIRDRYMGSTTMKVSYHKQLSTIKEQDEYDQNSEIFSRRSEKLKLDEEFKQYHIFCQIDDKKFHLRVKFTKKITIEKSKKQILNTYNKHFKNIDFKFQFDLKNISQYQFYPAKKNGIPKLELPQLENTQYVQSFHLFNFAIVF